MTLEDTSRIVMAMIGAFPGMSKNDMRPTILTWHRVLGHLDANIVEVAAYELLQSAKFFPPPAEVLEFARELLRDESKPKQLSAGMSDVSAEMVSKIMLAAKNGDLSEVRKGKDVSEYLSFMRNYFENIGENTVRNNLPEIMHFKQRQEYCLECGGVGVCPDEHCQTDIEIMAGGWCKLVMRECKYATRVKPKQQYAPQSKGRYAE